MVSSSLRFLAMAWQKVAGVVVGRRSRCDIGPLWLRRGVWRSPVIAIVLVALEFWLGAFLWMTLCYPRQVDVMVTPEYGHVATAMPFSFSFSNDWPKPQSFYAVLTVDQGWFASSHWDVQVSDRLEDVLVNGHPVPIRAGGSTAELHPIASAAFDATPHVHVGTNVITVAFTNTEKGGGFFLRPAAGPFQIFLLLLFLAPAIARLVSIFRLTNAGALVFALATTIAIAYWSATPYLLRSYDAGGHWDYIRHVTQKGIPSPHEGWVFYHPPLYYLIGSWVERVATWLRLPPVEAVQLLALGLWMVFVAAAMATVERYMGRKGAGVVIAVIGVACWPSGFTNSCRLGNDALVYALTAVAWYHLVLFLRFRTPWSGTLCAVCSALAILSKSNALLFAAGSALILAWSYQSAYRDRHERGRYKWALIGLGVACGAALVVNQSRILKLYLEGTLSDWLVSNVASLGENLRVGNSVRNFIMVDLPTYLSQPWANSFDDAAGRQNHWTTLLRTSLTGEFNMAGGFRDGASHMMAGILLAVLAIPAYQIVQRLSWHRLRHDRLTPMIGLALLLVAGSAVFRYHAPYACSSDFRYIFPVIIPGVIVCCSLGIAGRTAVLILSVLSVLFYGLLLTGPSPLPMCTSC